MNIITIFSLFGGLGLFLYGMSQMSESLEKAAGAKMRSILAVFTKNRFIGLLVGMIFTAIIQSSNATTVMVVSFVNSGLMTLRQSISVIMGANVGTTVTAWLLSLGDIDGTSVLVRLLKPTSFTPILAVIGIVLYLFCKSSRKKDSGVILLGFATLMFGMETMSGAVSGLRNDPVFVNLFLAFKNPLLGVVAGAVLTGIIQSSSASVGILHQLTGRSGGGSPDRSLLV